MHRVELGLVGAWADGRSQRATCHEPALQRPCHALLGRLLPGVPKRRVDREVHQRRRHPSAATHRPTARLALGPGPLFPSLLLYLVKLPAWKQGQRRP